MYELCMYLDLNSLYEILGVVMGVVRGVMDGSDLQGRDQS